MIALQEADLLLRPSVDQFPMLDFNRYDELVALGRECVGASRQELLALASGWGERSRP